MNLEELRTEIDAIDEAMTKLFIQRMAVVKRVADFKKANEMPVLDRSRELAKLDFLAQKVPADLQHYVAEFYEKLFELSRNHQKEHL